MILFIILGAVVLIAIAVIGVLFFMLEKEGKKEDEKAVPVPVTDLNKLKEEETKIETGIIPPLESNISLPTQEVQSPIEEEDYKTRAKELENELQIISQQATVQSSEAKKLIEVLTKENESLKAQQADLAEAQQKLNEVQGEAAGLKSDNVNLQTQLEATDAKVRLLEEQMAAVKIQMGDEIARANATVTELTKEKEALLSAPKPQSDEQMRQELETLRSEQAQLKQKYEELEKEHQKLQYELVKAKAQSSGLERVSFNYKNQLEVFLKKANTEQASNEQLTQAKNRLEGMVDQIKSENEELVKKDHLAQFELEKNRSRLVDLERENEDLKTRMQQQGQQ
jgi:chromosome segregation ATPase